ncbi:hypothetical protein Trydic_g3840 [Trypoxylus dichotomus]
MEVYASLTLMLLNQISHAKIKITKVNSKVLLREKGDGHVLGQDHCEKVDEPSNSRISVGDSRKSLNIRSRLVFWGDESILKTKSIMIHDVSEST